MTEMKQPGENLLCDILSKCLYILNMKNDTCTDTGMFLYQALIVLLEDMLC